MWKGFYSDGHNHNSRSIIQLSLLLLLTLMSVFAYAQYTSNAEYKLKVALIYKLTKFVEWPEETIEKYDGFGICLIGNDSFGLLFDVLQKRKVAGQQIHTRRITSADVINDDCKVVFINVTNKVQLESIIRSLQGRPVLTISDHVQFVEMGGMVQFISKNNRMGFNINYDSSVNAGLSIAAQLLELASELIKTDGDNSR